MTRARADALLLEEAFEALSSESFSQIAESGERLKPDAPPSAERGEEDPAAPSILDRALAGHSPSARALANASDHVVALADLAASSIAAAPTLVPPAAAPGPEPPARLRDRIMRDVQLPPAGGGPLSGGPLVRSPSTTQRSSVDLRPVLPTSTTLVPNEAVGRMHAASAEEKRRAAAIEHHHMRGGAGQEATDRALRLLIDQYAPFLGFEVVFVSTVVGDVTIHRVHRGFPIELGNIDVVPRELSFCTHTVSAAEPLFVEDASKEAFFRQSDLVQKFGCRAYLGVPLFAEEVALGALCGISFSAQAISSEDVTIAKQFAKIAEALVTHDEAAIARLIVDPVGYPSLAPKGPPILGASVFEAITAAQRGRAGAPPRTWLAQLERARFDALAPGLPASLLAGSSGGGVGILVPDAHPALVDPAPSVRAVMQGALRLDPASTG